jgi:hypothetical protein
MSLVFDITVVTAAAVGGIVGGSIAFLFAGMVAANKRNRLYTRGWNAGIEFEATRQLRQIRDNTPRR